MLLDALTGFAGGAAQEVVEISKDERRALAEKLKMEAKAEIDRLAQGRVFQQQKDIVGMEAENQGLLEKTRQENRMAVAEREAALRESGSEKEFLRQKSAGMFEKEPTRLRQGEKLVDRSGNEIASNFEGMQTPLETEKGGSKTSDEKNYERFLSENQNYNGDFMSWKKAWSAPDQRKSALEMAQNDMRVMKDQAQLQMVANEYLQYLTGDGGVQQVRDNTFDITELVKKGRALRGVK